MSDQIDAFRRFFEVAEPRVRHALTGLYGIDLGREATAEAFAYAWEHWDRIAAMENPVGYVYVTGRSRGRRRPRRRVVLPPPPEDRTPMIEPGLAAALGALLDGARGAYRDIVLLNAAAALVVADRAADLVEGAQLAAAVIDDGRAGKALADLVAATNTPIEDAPA